MSIFLLGRIILPIIGFTSILVLYTFIIAKRYEKKLLIDDLVHTSGREANIYKLTDLSEKLWWNLSITIIFIAYFGFTLYFFSIKKNSPFLIEALVIGFIMWCVIALIGWKITRR